MANDEKYDSGHMNPAVKAVASGTALGVGLYHLHRARKSLLSAPKVGIGKALLHTGAHATVAAAGLAIAKLAPKLMTPSYQQDEYRNWKRN